MRSKCFKFTIFEVKKKWILDNKLSVRKPTKKSRDEIKYVAKVKIPYDFFCRNIRLTSVVDYKLPTNIFDSSERDWQISASPLHNTTNTIRLCLNFIERRALQAARITFSFPERSPIKRGFPRRYDNVYTLRSFETFLLRYPIKRHLSLKRILNVLVSISRSASRLQMHIHIA